MYRLKISIIAICLCGIFTGSFAQPLDDLIDTALTRNLAIKSGYKQYLASLERVPQVNRLPDPEFGVGGFVLPVETRLGAQVVRLSGQQMIPWFGTLNAREELALAKSDAAKQPVEIKALDVRYGVEKSYFDLYKLEQSEEIIQRSIDVLNVLREFIISRVQSGNGSTADVLRLDLKIRELRQEIAILESDKSAPTALINQFLNQPTDTRIYIGDSITFASVSVDRDTLLDYLLQTHPSIQWINSRQEIANREIELNQKERKPSLGFGVDYIFVNPRSDATPANNGRDILQLKAMITVPIYGEKYAAKDREQRLKIEALEDQKLDEVNMFIAYIDKAYSDYEAAKLRYDLYLEQAETTRAVIEVVRADYSARGNNFDELLDLEMDLIGYDLRILDAVVQSHLAAAEIEKYDVVVN